MTYEPQGLRLGGAVTAGSVVILAAIGAGGWIRRRKKER